MMKILRLLVVAVLFLGINHVAHAFAITILDPSGPGYSTIDPGVPFPVTFVPCIFDPSEGCFLGQNTSKTTLTTLDLTFPDTSSLDGQPVTCNTVGSLFGAASCSLSGDDYILNFSAGTGIPPWTIFLIIEDGVCPQDFPTGNAVADPTPEPSSIWLALSGMGSLGYLVRRRRRGLVA
jgi:hypothetical protein